MFKFSCVVYAYCCIVFPLADESVEIHDQHVSTQRQGRLQVPAASISHDSPSTAWINHEEEDELASLSPSAPQNYYMEDEEEEEEADDKRMTPPPPYTETAEDGHISLGHCSMSPFKQSLNEQLNRSSSSGRFSLPLDMQQGSSLELMRGTPEPITSSDPRPTPPPPLQLPGVPQDQRLSRSLSLPPSPWPPYLPYQYPHPLLQPTPQWALSHPIPPPPPLIPRSVPPEDSAHYTTIVTPPPLTRLPPLVQQHPPSSRTKAGRRRRRRHNRAGGQEVR